VSTIEERGRRSLPHTLFGLGLLCGAALLLSCEQPEPQTRGSEAPVEKPDPLAITSKKRRLQPSLRDLGEKGRRVKVIVLPGDASVEIDGVAAGRKNGVIELVGRVGEVRRLRVFKGAEQLEENVTIEEATASPAVLDLAALSPKQGGDNKAPIKPGGLQLAPKFE